MIAERAIPPSAGLSVKKVFQAAHLFRPGESCFGLPLSLSLGSGRTRRSGCPPPPDISAITGSVSVGIQQSTNRSTCAQNEGWEAKGQADFHPFCPFNYPGWAAAHRMCR